MVQWHEVGHKVGHALGFEYGEDERDRVTRGESVTSTAAEAYIEPEPTFLGWFNEFLPSRGGVFTYFHNLFPFTYWLFRYNKQWLFGDLVAGITVGAVVVPQGMAYSNLANLAPQYGLYSSFVGVIIYWFFATSKDITIGPVAVMSQLIGTIVNEVGPRYPDAEPQEIASSVALICGGIVTGFGLLRVGWVVDFIPLPAIAAFMTGSAINIAAGQVSKLLGNDRKKFNTRGATYETIINTLKYLNYTDINAAVGLTALFLLYVIRFACNHLAKRYPRRQRFFFFLNTLRTVFVILLYTLISWLVNRHHRGEKHGQPEPILSIIKDVPRGFQDMAVPKLDSGIISAYAGHLPSAVIVLLIEHIAIAKSFGRINGYTIDPSQELIAIGVTNLIGPFFGAYPATGSFSRTAIKSKAGVRTPFAGVISGLVVLLAVYALPAVFFYVSNASLAAVIIHAVGDLILPPKQAFAFWRVSPLDALIFLGGVIIIVFTSIEIGIYCTVCVSAAVLLWRIAKAHGEFLGRIRVQTIDGRDARHIWLPIEHEDGSNPAIAVTPPAPGILVYRFTESLTYPNANHYTDQVVAEVKRVTKRSKPLGDKPGDRPWNDPATPSADELAADPRPPLKAIIFDFAAVNHVDVTSTQVLVDVRDQLDRWAAPGRVQWHFANIRQPWVKRALAAVGFGKPDGTVNQLFSVASAGPYSSDVANEGVEDIEVPSVERPAPASRFSSSKLLPILSTDRTFHPDLDEAIAAVLEQLGQQDDGSPSVSSFDDAEKRGQPSTGASSGSSTPRHQ